MKTGIMIGVVSVVFGLGLGFNLQAAEHAPLDQGNAVPGIDETILDRTVQPCQDFYRFSCGKWLDTAQIPADLPAWDRSFSAIWEKSRLTLKKILENYASGKLNEPENPYAQKLGDFYGACMNEKRVEETALPELKEELKKIDSLQDEGSFKQQLADVVASLHLKGANAFFYIGDEQDFKDATKVIAVVDQGGLSLPDRDYYLKDDPKTLEIRKDFLKYAQTILEFVGSSRKQAREQARKILEIETFLAKNSMSRVDRRSPFNVYHRLERKGLKEKAPGFDWDRYFSRMGLPDVQAINVTVPEFFGAFNQLLTPLEGQNEKNAARPVPALLSDLGDLKLYLKWHLTSALIPTMSKKFVNENFRFVSKNFTGQKELEVRWKRCLGTINSKMGLALGRSFVKSTYGPESKALTGRMIQNIEKSFGEELKSIQWMDDSTKKQAYKKLHAIVNKVGYPEVWRSYDTLKVDSKSFMKSVLSGEEFNLHYQLNKIGKPLDRAEWQVSPQIVNAYYSPSLNEMVFPAGILQWPFFNREAPMQDNYGGIGMVMGHELTHGFDDQGRHYDAAGNLVDWWSPEVAKAFEERAKCVVNEYNSFEILPGVFINGELTLGENIADQGGIRLAYRAWKESHSSEGGQKALATGASGLSQEQQFFVAFAQTWCSKKQEQLMRTKAKTDPHSPAQFRVNGALSQFSDFSDAFQCKPGSPMAPVNRCVIW